MTIPHWVVWGAGSALMRSGVRPGLGRQDRLAERLDLLARDFLRCAFTVSLLTLLFFWGGGRAIPAALFLARHHRGHRGGVKRLVFALVVVAATGRPR